MYMGYCWVIDIDVEMELGYGPTKSMCTRYIMFPAKEERSIEVLHGSSLNALYMGTIEALHEDFIALVVL